jgi:hypothetical protein
VNSDCVEVDALVLEMAADKNDYAYAAAERPLQKCSTNLEAYQYLLDRARDELRKMVCRIQTRLRGQRDSDGWNHNEPLGASVPTCLHRPCDCASLLDHRL